MCVRMGMCVHGCDRRVARWTESYKRAAAPAPAYQWLISDHTFTVNHMCNAWVLYGGLLTNSKLKLETTGKTMSMDWT